MDTSTIEIPEDFKNLLEQNQYLVYFSSMSKSHQKEYLNWIEEAKKEETRKSRMRKCMEMLKQKLQKS